MSAVTYWCGSPDCDAETSVIGGRHPVLPCPKCGQHLWQTEVHSRYEADGGPAYIARLLRSFEVGSSVVASMGIIYARLGISVQPGTRGRVVAPPGFRGRTLTGMVFVRWDGIDAGDAIATTADAVDPVTPIQQAEHDYLTERRAQEQREQELLRLRLQVDTARAYMEQVAASGSGEDLRTALKVYTDASDAYLAALDAELVRRRSAS